MAREIGANFRQFGDHIEARAILKPHIDDSERRRLLADQIDAFRNGMAETHLEAAKLHGARQTLQE